MHGVLATLPVGVGLQVGFYAQSCPRAEIIVRDTLLLAIQSDSGAAPGILRLIFHDCFVRGCDASVLLDSVGTQLAEKDGKGILLRGLDAVDQIKAALEAACPGVVSCADLLAFASRDSVVATGGPTWDVEAGRRDGSVSNAAEAGPPNLPVAQFKTPVNAAIFAGKGFTLDEMVTLSGSHSIGQARCLTFADRRSANNSTLDPTYGATLNATCSPANTTDVRLNLDLTTPNQFDSAYYSNLVVNKGLLTSDQDLYTDTASQQLVLNDANNQAIFFSKFATAMTELGRMDVLLSPLGEIRKNCRVVN